MKNRLATYFIILTIGSSLPAYTQSLLPYHAIPEVPSAYTPATTVARLIDGLGFRYYWATEGLTSSDLAFKPSVEARSTDETLTHILSLCISASNIIINEQGEHFKLDVLSYEEKRRLTLEALETASNHLKSNPDLDLESLAIPGGDTSFPFWYLINGHLSDALTHVGQVVSFRRSSGNPVNPKVSVFKGIVVD
tara:strand:- start:1535 stop:2116 length:582 start_codon:yes stop_codon:yes gene_type:complete